MKVLALDNLQQVGIDVFLKEGIEVDVKGKMTPEELGAVISNYDGVVVRGATKATAATFEHATRGKGIGRAGSGTDNIDKVAATKKGIVVMNTPGGHHHHHGRARPGDDDWRWRARSRRPRLDEGREVGEEQVHGHRAHRLRPWAWSAWGPSARWSAERAVGLKMVVIAFDHTCRKRTPTASASRRCRWTSCYRRAISSLSTPLDPGTKGMVNASRSRR